MKLAEALLLRADMLKKLASLRERIAQNAVVQDGEKPYEDPTELLAQAAGVIAEQEKLVVQINATNIASRLSDGRTLAQAVAARNALAQRHSLLVASIAAVQKEPDRYSVREIKWKATLDVAKLQKQIEDLAKQIRELNAAIQQANWKVDLQ